MQSLHDVRLAQIWVQMEGTYACAAEDSCAGEAGDSHACEAEGADGPEGFREINIESKLLDVSLEGLDAVHKAMQAAACLAAQLVNVQDTLEFVSDTIVSDTMHSMRLQHPGDDLETRSAVGLLEIDQLLRQLAANEAPPLPVAAEEALKLLQRHMQDVVLLSCSRFIAQTELWSKGISWELLRRLVAAFGQEALDDDSLWSRLGNSKYHVFTQGVRFGERKHRHGRGGRKSRRTPIVVVATTEPGSWEGEPMRLPVPAAPPPPPRPAKDARGSRGGALLAAARAPLDLSLCGCVPVGEPMSLPVAMLPTSYS